MYTWGEESAAENFEYRKQVQNTLAEMAEELRGAQRAHRRPRAR